MRALIRRLRRIEGAAGAQTQRRGAAGGRAAPKASSAPSRGQRRALRRRAAEHDHVLAWPMPFGSRDATPSPAITLERARVLIEIVTDNNE
jgi:hypothetical protein